MAESMDKKNQQSGEQSRESGQHDGRGNQPGQSQQVNPGRVQPGRQQDKKGGQFGNEEDDKNRDRERRAS